MVESSSGPDYSIGGQTLSEPHSARFEEEWLAELEHVPGGPVTKSVWAARIWIGRNKIAKELGEAESTQRSVNTQLEPATAQAVAVAPKVTVRLEPRGHLTMSEIARILDQSDYG
ncbi:hypothetical protein [Nocardia africana]|uniref:Uncharacterized protein n=1 Tax=Nocardia africana TaxID=134964 RepID=A0ABW6NTQ0_9NOCA